MDDPRLKILVVHGDVPPPNRDAMSLRLLRVVELLAHEGHRVTFLARGGGQQEENAALLLRMGVAEVFPLDPQRISEAQPQAGWRFTIPMLDLEGLLASRRFDVAWLSLYDIAEQYLPLIRRHSPDTRIVVDSTDVQWVREHRGATLAGDPAAIAAAERTRRRERDVYAAADVNVAISEVDAQATRELAPEVPVEIVSLAQSFPPVEVSPAGRSGLLFVGNFYHAPNVDGVVEFHRSTWPLIRRALPNAHLTLVGIAPPPEVEALAGDDVTVTGWVPEVEPYLKQARLSIAPLRYGAGVKGKIAESIAAGVPVVTTTIGAEGMHLHQGEDILVADDPAAFAAAVVRLHSDDDLWLGLATGARQRLAEQVGPEAARAGIRRALRRACPVRWQAGADEPWLAELLAAFARSFAPGDPATLVLTVPAADRDAPQRAFDRITCLVGELGLDLDEMADIEISAWAGAAGVQAAGLPAGTLLFDGPPEPVAAEAPASPAAEEPALLSLAGRRRHVPRVAVVVEASSDPVSLQRQLEALDRSLPSDGVETVIAAYGHSSISGPMLDGREGVLRWHTHPGREATHRLGFQATSAPVVVTLGPLALPQPGFLEPLVQAVEAGASFAAPTIDGARGLRVHTDGSLWPLAHDSDAPVDALPFDCLASRREIWEQAPLALPMREGHPERQLAAWAAEHGPLAAVREAQLERLDSGPVSVIICTRNRAEELAEGVGLLVAQGATRNGSEIIIVDNASTDATAELSLELAARYPGVRVIREERPGLSHARNAGAAAARNPRLCYLDDDARPAPGWRESMAWALGCPGIAAAGGPIAALWPAQREPNWPPDGLEGSLSVLDRGDIPQLLVPPEIAYGANWAIRQPVLESVGGFDGHLGYSPDVHIGGEEVAVAWRVHLRGLGGTLYVPGGAVGHRISPDRLHDSYLVRRMFAVGIEHAHLRAEREGRGYERLVTEASTAAAQLLQVLPLSGDMELEEALARVQAADELSVKQRTVASEALGLLSATVLLLDERELEMEELTLRLRPEHLRGVLAPLPLIAGAAG